MRARLPLFFRFRHIGENLCTRELKVRCKAIGDGKKIQSPWWPAAIVKPRVFVVRNLHTAVANLSFGSLFTRPKRSALTERPMSKYVLLKEPTLSGNVKIRPDGYVTLPLVNEIQGDLC
jgi:hypothetical protein